MTFGQTFRYQASRNVPVPRELELWVAAIAVVVSIAYLTYEESDEPPLPITADTPAEQPSPTITQRPHGTAAVSAQVVTGEVRPWFDDAKLFSMDASGEPPYKAAGGQREPFVYPGVGEPFSWPEAGFGDGHLPAVTNSTM